MSKKVLFIFGCQRSGTTATIIGLKERKEIKIFNETNDEIHRVSNDNNKIRLRKHGRLNRIFDNYKEPIIVVKPLVESQNAVELLDYFDNSSALWLYRDYRGVISSMIKKWGENAGRAMINAILNPKIKNWRNEKIDPKITKLVKALIENNTLNKYDYCALFWYIRNNFYYEQALYNHCRIRLAKYTKLVSEISYLQNHITNLNFDLKLGNNFYHSKSVGKGRVIKLNPIVEELCSNMMGRLDTDHQFQFSKYSYKSFEAFSDT